MLKLENQDLVLDNGAGNGRLSIAIAQKGVNVVAVDINKSILQVALKKIRRLGLDRKVNIVLSSMDNLPFKDKVFTKILCIHNLWYIRRYSVAVQEMFRVLQDAGKLIVDHLSLTNPYSLFAQFKSVFSSMPLYLRTPKQILKPFRKWRPEIYSVKKWGIPVRLILVCKGRARAQTLGNVMLQNLESSSIRVYSAFHFFLVLKVKFGGFCFGA